MRRLGRSGLLVAASGLLVLVSSFLPWWVVRLGDGRVVTASAWRISSRWSEAVVLTVAAAGVWLVWRLVRGRVPWVVWMLALVAMTAAVFLTLDQRAEVLAPGAPVDYFVYSSEGLVAPPLVRDAFERWPGVETGLGRGFWTGLAAMLLTGTALAAAGTSPDGRY